MKSVKVFLFVLGLSLNTTTILAQDKNDTSLVVKNSFTVEINADTTFEDLTLIEKMLKDNYNVDISFNDVRIENNKITALRMKMMNGNQSFMKSIQNNNSPIDSFKIVIHKEDGRNIVAIDNGYENPFQSIGNASKSFWNSFKNDIPQIKSDFNDIEDDFNKMFERMKESTNKMNSIFKNLENDPKAKKEVIKNSDGSITTIISKEA